MMNWFIAEMLIKRIFGNQTTTTTTTYCLTQQLSVSLVLIVHLLLNDLFINGPSTIQFSSIVTKNSMMIFVKSPKIVWLLGLVGVNNKEKLSNMLDKYQYQVLLFPFILEPNQPCDILNITRVWHVIKRRSLWIVWAKSSSQGKNVRRYSGYSELNICVTHLTATRWTSLCHKSVTSVTSRSFAMVCASRGIQVIARAKIRGFSAALHATWDTWK